jgi:hypothetical protein
MADPKSIQWIRLSVEASAIVASILLAFAIDAWWAEQQDRRAENEVLNRLHEEFTLNRDGIGARGLRTEYRWLTSSFLGSLKRIGIVMSRYSFKMH